MKRRVVTLSFVLAGAALASPLTSASAHSLLKTHHSTGASAGRTAHAFASGGHSHVRLIGAWSGGHGRHKLHFANLKGGKVRYAWGGGGLQCVPFARAVSGIELKGNAAEWWDAAAGVYQRGTRPEPGSVLNFRATWGMRLGHVAVVTAVRDSRLIEIEHANWNKGAVARNVEVEDVSPANDWSEVRVGLGHGGEFGSTYPTYGFIYDRPDSGIMVANDAGGGSELGGSALAQAGVRPAAYREVAELPARGRHHTHRGHRPLSLELPARDLLLQ
jgi:hypothetical protein